MGNPADLEGKAVDPTCHLKVTARYLSKGWKGSIYDISKEEFWNQDNSQDVVRQFPFAGVYWNKNWKKYEGVHGLYPCYTPKRSDDNGLWVPALYLRISDISGNSDVLSHYGLIMYPYRLFTDEL